MKTAFILLVGATYVHGLVIQKSPALVKFRDGKKDNIYYAATTCADDIISAYPSLGADWVYPNGTFGGRESDKFVGWVDSGNTVLPDLNMMDGPQGVRDILNGAKYEQRTSWPAAATHGMAWSPELSYYAGKTGARDWLNVDANVALTPGANVHRLPINGRNWEYVSGEDSHLGVLAARLMSGFQSEGVMATLKHFALNSQELNRMGTIAIIDEATLMQSYLTAFQPTIDAGVGALMCSYNQIQFAEDPSSHAYTCGSEVLIGQLLREQMGFGGAVMTDWDADMTNTTRGETTMQRQWADWEMVWGYDITTQVPPSAYDRIARHGLIGMLASGTYSNSSVDSCTAAGVKVPTTAPDQALLPAAYQAGLGDAGEVAAHLIAEGMVMLKNENQALPLAKGQKILLAGNALLNGGGSGDSAAFGYFAPDHQGEGLHNGGRMAQDAMRNELAAALGAVVTWDYDSGASKNPADYDVIIAFGAQFRSEAYLVDNQDGFYNIDQCDSGTNSSLYGHCDYPSFLDVLQSSSTTLISVTTTGGAHIAFDYLDSVDAALTLFYPGQHFATALAKVLSGAISPGGKLTYTLPDMETTSLHIQSPVGRFNDGLAYKSSHHQYTLQYPAYLWDAESNQASNIIQYGNVTSEYAEKGLIGYKYFEKYGMKPLFPFGFGLSFADYSVDGIFSGCKSVEACVVAAKVSGAYGNGIASEVLQVYVGFVAKAASAQDAMRPIKELRGFLKVWSSGSFEVPLGDAAFRTEWNTSLRQWQYPCQSTPGSFVVSLGTSSADIVGSISIACPSAATIGVANM